ARSHPASLPAHRAPARGRRVSRPPRSAAPPRLDQPDHGRGPGPPPPARASRCAWTRSGSPHRAPVEGAPALRRRGSRPPGSGARAGMSGGERPPPVPSLADVAAYFLRLGALGFGGPVALASAMRRDLVDRRGWLTETEYDSGLAIAAACPGPLAYQLGVYAGYIRQGLAGALAVAVAFGFVPFVLVVAVAALYTRLGDAGALRAVFYGVGPVVVALIVKGCGTLGRRTLRRDATAWTLAVAAAGVAAVLEREL